jgi:hypothetical protein
MAQFEEFVNPSTTRRIRREHAGRAFRAAPRNGRGSDPGRSSGGIPRAEGVPRRALGRRSLVRDRLPRGGSKAQRQPAHGVGLGAGGEAGEP